MEKRDNSMKKPIGRCIIGTLILITMGWLGIEADHNVFLEGIPFPLVYVIILGIGFELSCMFSSIYSSKHSISFIFRFLIISSISLIFIVGLSNLFGGPPGGNDSISWLGLVSVSMLGILFQLYFTFGLITINNSAPKN